MLDVKVVCSDIETAKQVQDKICNLFQGLAAFKNNELIVTDVTEEEGSKDDLPYFFITDFKTEVNKQYVLFGDMLLISLVSNEEYEEVL